MEENFWGQLIKSLREERGISQRALSAETDINRSTLRNIENGSLIADIDVMEKLLGFFGYDLEAIYRGTTPGNLRNASEGKLTPERRSRLAAAKVLAFRL